jgi:hypothetical protein
MGMYPNCGFEYIIIINDNLSANQLNELGLLQKTYTIQNTRFICIISQNETNDRLIKTKYYLNNKLSWFTSPCESLIKLNESDILDYPIPNDEINLINFVTTDPLLSPYIIEHGWYNVIRHH